MHKQKNKQKAEDSTSSSKWSLKTLEKVFLHTGKDWKKVKEGIHDVIIKELIRNCVKPPASAQDIRRNIAFLKLKKNSTIAISIRNKPSPICVLYLKKKSKKEFPTIELNFVCKANCSVFKIRIAPTITKMRQGK